MKIKNSLWLCFLLTTCWAPLTSAAELVVYDNGAGGASGIIGIKASDQNFNVGLFQADDVTLGSTTTVTAVEWTGGFSRNPATANFTIDIFADAGGAPSGAALASFNVGDAVNRVDSGIDVLTPNSNDIYNFSADINFAMNAGTTYWISIFNDSSFSELFFWGRGGVGNSFDSNDNRMTWARENIRQDFRLRAAAVPEPSSLLFLSLLSTVALCRRR